MLGLACLVGAASASQARVLVSQIRVYCVTQNEIGQDEIFLKFNGNRLNMGNFSNGTNTPSATTYTFASTPVTVELWEDDGNHWYDGDDQWDSNSWSDLNPHSVHNIWNGGQSHDYWYYFTLSFTP